MNTAHYTVNGVGPSELVYFQEGRREATRQNRPYGRFLMPFLLFKRSAGEAVTEVA